MIIFITDLKIPDDSKSILLQSGAAITYTLGNGEDIELSIPIIGPTEVWALIIFRILDTKFNCISGPMVYPCEDGSVFPKYFTFWEKFIDSFSSADIDYIVDSIITYDCQPSKRKMDS